ncbi:autotransporter outer membrane beta-barrel domain-containing protein [uncultured Selenomonas sp.]|uniref:autotransporter outer membrane beta-barrel domain-containing protein n=1 Tax=uncultured Selenomonas sp. TaxID=159275 RepID=UPI0028EC0140|nr:autotransporter outer membrane beta-barrel domain-containing protein [uncultured Selenomonas sp.]
MTTVAGGKASNNVVTINEGVTLDDSRSVYGGSAINGSSVDNNKVYLNGIRTSGTVYGGSTGRGTANGNEVHLNGATVTKYVYGGDSPTSTSKNKVYLNGATVTRSVYGGTGGTANGNEVHLNGATVTGGVYGGSAVSTNDNKVYLNGATVMGDVTGGNAASANDNEVHLNGATVTGAVIGGAIDGTGNLLSVKGVNSAGRIARFQKLHFDATGVAAGETMLNVNGSAGTTLDRGAIDAKGSTVNGGITLLHNANGITVNGLAATDNILKSETDATTEKNISVHKTGSNITDIRYEGYQFADVTTAVTTATEAYGGISKAGNSTHDNVITVNGAYANVYGGHTSGAGTTRDDKDNSYRNSVTITGGTLGNVYGGYTESATGTTTGNTVNIGDGTNALTAGTTIAEIHGGNRTAQGNKLVVNTATTVGKVLSFEKFIFNHTASAGTTPMLTITNGATDLDFNAIEATDAATENPVTLVHNSAGLNLTNYDAAKVKSTLNEAGTQETNIDVRKTGALNTDVIRYAYTFAGATAATTVGSDTWGGRSVAGNTTTGNTITVENGAHTNVYGGWTTGTGSTAAAERRGDSISNKVTVNGSATVGGTVYGGYTDALGGKATGNEVTIDKVSAGSVVGGYGAITNDNVINLRNATVGGTVTGGTATNGTGNTLAVYYGTGTTSIGDFSGIQNLHFDLENAPTDGTAHTLLNLTSAAGEKSFSNINLDIHRSGATKKLRKGDSFTLVDNTTAGGSVSIGDNVTAEGTDGVTRKYTFAVAQDPNDAHKLVATVTKAGLGEQAKSLVETRAGASAFLNDGADFLAGAGMNAAQKEARAAAMTGSAPYGIWAGMGAGSLRHKTGSYVDMKGWNLGVGWARENAVKEGTLTFGPFIEYGRGSYDSYLDDGTHGSGKTSFFGAGVMAKLETKANNWIDGSLRVGRTKSDYTGLDTSYDTTSTYYAMHVGVGKDFHVREGDTVSAYVRYSYAHTAGTSAHLSSGETYDFDAVNSHRLRIGTRYTHGETALSQLYAGLAWEYEFDGDARATYDGDSTPSPSLKGGSALLELGYRFAPKADSRVSYDLNLSGWQGKRQGVTGGVSVKWAF